MFEFLKKTESGDKAEKGTAVQAHGRKLVGRVVSDKMKKTIVVAIDRMKMNTKYHKQYTMTSKFKVHDENNEYHIGDKVVIQETRPISKEKRWRVISKA